MKLDLGCLDFELEDGEISALESVATSSGR
jgi:hypothetical protein